MFRHYRPTPNKRMKIMANVNNLFRFRAFNTAPLNQERPFCLVIGSQINEDGWKRELNAMVESDEHFTQTLIRLNLAICMPPTKKEYDDFNSSQSQIYILDASDEEGIATFIEHVNASTKDLHPSSSYKNLHFAITLLGFGTSKEVNPTSYIAPKLRPLLEMQGIIAVPELWEALLTEWNTPISQHIASRDFTTSISRYSKGGKCFVYFCDECGNKEEYEKP